MLFSYIRSICWCRRYVLSSLAWLKEVYQRGKHEMKLARDARAPALSLKAPPQFVPSESHLLDR
jgi:hypothetical protein